MFPGYFDFLLHLAVGLVSFAVGGKFAAVTYGVFALLQLLLLWGFFGGLIESIPQQKAPPLWLLNFVTNLVSVFFVTLFAVDWVRSSKKALVEDIDRLSVVLAAPPRVDSYRLDNEWCQSGCSVEELNETIDFLIAQKDLADAYLTTLWWDTTPFTWAFFVISTFVPLCFSLRHQRR